MGRLTKAELTTAIDIFSHPQSGDESDIFAAYTTARVAMKELKHYKDLEEAGRLIKLKRGMWITETIDVRGRTEILGHYCSNCEHYEEAPEDITNVEDFYTNYCPNCGAKMKSEVAE